MPAERRDESGQTLDQAEDALLDAMRASDVEALDKLIGDGLRFTLPDGSVIGKQADLEAHRSGATRFDRIEETGRRTTEYTGGGSTETIARAALSDNGQPREATLRWRRAWQIIDGRWQVVEGSVTPER
jgi:hypothetical protein